MNDNEFLRQQQAAVERMREMNSRAMGQPNSYHKMPPVPSFVQVPENSNRRNVAQQNKNSAYKQTSPKPSPPVITETDNKIKKQKATQNNSNFLSQGLNLPFLDMLGTDKDAALIIGLLLILMSEKSDKILLFALVYILL